MIGPLQHDEALVSAVGSLVDVFPIADKIVTLHGHNENRYRNAPDCAWNGVVTAAPIYFGFIQRVRAENCIGAQERSYR
jgi:hypothetical protein